jgi:hypothetical protein
MDRGYCIECGMEIEFGNVKCSKCEDANPMNEVGDCPCGGSGWWPSDGWQYIPVECPYHSPFSQSDGV